MSVLGLRRWLPALLLLVLLAPAAHAVQPDEMLANPALEARAEAIGKQLRCLVCQNESIEESQAPLAHDLRVLLRKRLLAGDTNQQAINYIVARYGEFVLLKPRFEPKTLLLWGSPVIALLAGALLVVVTWRRRRRDGSSVEAELSAAEQARLAAILKDSDGGSAA